MHEIVQAFIQHGYTLLFLWVFLERLGVPIPASLLLIAAGILIEMDHMQALPAFLLAFLPAMLADSLWFFLGRYRGNRILTFICRISLEPDVCVRKTENVFIKHGPVSLIFSKFIPGLNHLMVPLAGIVRMLPRTFIAFDGIGTLLWVGAFMSIGYFFSREVELEKIVLLDGDQGSVIIAIVVLLVLLIAGKYLYRQYRLRVLFANRITPEELRRKMDAKEEIAIVDVRHPLELEADPFMIPGAVYVPVEDIRQFRVDSAGKEIVTYCA